MRCFVAVDIDEVIIKAVADLQARLAKDAGLKKGDVKWVQPDAMHLTLKFLGEVDDKKITDVCDIVRQAATEKRKFELAIETLGCFGGSSARVLWVGTGEGSEQLGALQEAVESGLEKAGWPREERKFTGHLTLCRVRSISAGAKLAAMIKNYEDLRFGSAMIDSVKIYESQLLREGPVYTVLGNYRLE